jgi:hypothetical protein
LLQIGGEEDGHHANKAVLPAAMLTAKDSNNINGDSIIDNRAAVGGYRYSCIVVWLWSGDGVGPTSIWREASREKF